MRKFEFMRLEYLAVMGFGAYESPDRIRFIGSHEEFWAKVNQLGSEGYEIAAGGGTATEIIYMQREVVD